MSYYRPPLPGTWIEGSVISAEELNALDLANDLRAAYGGHVPGAKSKIERPAKDECHHCGAPSPGSICRYCNTMHRRITT